MGEGQTWATYQSWPSGTVVVFKEDVNAYVKDLKGAPLQRIKEESLGILYRDVALGYATLEGFTCHGILVDGVLYEGFTTCEFDSRIEPL